MDYHSGDSLIGFFGFEGTKKVPLALIFGCASRSGSSRRLLIGRSEYVVRSLAPQSVHFEGTD